MPVDQNASTMTFLSVRPFGCLLLLATRVLSLSVLDSKGKVATDHQRFTTPLITRRLWLLTGAATTAVATASLPVEAIPPPPIEGIGGGADIRTPLPATAPDVVYPRSLEGLWQCQRVVTMVEGNTEQALVAWKGLGGGDGSLFANKKMETFLTKYIITKKNGDTVLDRGFEIASRVGVSPNDVSWDATNPNLLSYKDSKGQSVQLTVVQRRTEPPSDQGFGFNELIRITTPAAFGADVQRCAQVKRRYRRAYDEQGNRVVEGIEICKTFRVLDGVAGVELPTSTTKTQITMTRPQQMQS